MPLPQNKFMNKTLSWWWVTKQLTSDLLRSLEWQLRATLLSANTIYNKQTILVALDIPRTWYLLDSINYQRVQCTLSILLISSHSDHVLPVSKTSSTLPPHFSQLMNLVIECIIQLSSSYTLFLPQLIRAPWRIEIPPTIHILFRYQSVVSAHPFMKTRLKTNNSVWSGASVLVEYSRTP